MFKRVLESLSKSLGGNKSKPAPAPQPAAKQSKAAPAPAPSPSKQTAAPAGKGASVLDKVAAAPAKPVEAKKAASPEELCGITSKMTKDQIGAQLKLLYRRYNRGASSLDPKVRAEADQMLDAIVAIREKTFGEL